jgi:hypothetical protein
MREKQSISGEEIAKFKNASQEQIDQAHDQANMLKAEAGHGLKTTYKGRDQARREGNSEIGKWKTRPITPEEYDKANQIIEELEATITNQVGIKKVLSKVAYGSLAIILAASGIFELGINLDEMVKRFKKEMSFETLNKARAKLNEMKTQGQEYGEERAELGK